MLQQIFDGISDPLIMLDKDGLAKMVNKAAMDYHGAGQVADVLGKPCFRGLRGRETACAGCDYPFPSAERQAVAFERKGLNDTRKLENVTIYPILGESGRRDAIIIKITDVTQAKLLERQMFHNEKLASLGLVTSGIAHELNHYLLSAGSGLMRGPIHHACDDLDPGVFSSVCFDTICRRSGHGGRMGDHSEPGAGDLFIR